MRKEVGGGKGQIIEVERRIIEITKKVTEVMS